MAEELQHLIDRIQKDAVEAAEKQSTQVLAQAKEKAAAVVKEAEEKARAFLARAEKDAEAFTERSTRTLEQAARDLLISVGQGVENILADVVGDSVEKALRPEVLEQMLVKMAEAYASHQGDEGRINLLISPQDQQALVKYFAEQYKQRLVHGVELHVDSGIFKGFKVSFVNSRAYHDFTKEAIAEALVNFLRPQLSEIVHRVAREESQTEKGPRK
jgi:V/A-type H+/Na+-transporting ATPase subunit E